MAAPTKPTQSVHSEQQRAASLALKEGRHVRWRERVEEITEARLARRRERQGGVKTSDK
jgi:hypothetical protein